MIKQFFIKLKFKSLLKASLPKGQSNASILFLVDVDVFDVNLIKSKFEMVFGKAYTVEFICFTQQKKKIRDEKNSYFSTKDFSFLGNFLNTKLQHLIEQDYEYVFQFFTTEQLYLNYISAKSKTNLRLGFQNVNPTLTDLIFNINQNDLDLFFKEAKKYLEIIKKST